MAKKNINDPDFFEDANMDAMAEAVDVVDPDAGAEDAADDVVVDDDQAEDDGGAADSDADSGEGVADADAEGDADPAPHLSDPDEIKVAYAEIRKLANKTARENQELREQLAQLQTDAQVEYDYDEPAYDTQAFTTMAGQDPRAAFQYALQSGQASDAQAAIARVQADAAEVAALAALAHRDGDQTAYAELNRQAVNMHAEAQAMHGEYAQAVYTAQQAPFVEAERNRNLAAAEQHLAQQTQGDFTARRAQVIRVLSERPHLIQGHSAQDIHKGLSDAYTIARSLPDPVNVEASIDEKVAAAVKAQVAATRAAKSKAADAAAGATGGRSVPAGGGAQEPSLKDDIYNTQKAASLGARNFMAL